MKTHPKVDEFFNRPGKWREEMAKLRSIVLACGLTEAFKWGNPCYTLGQSNIVLIHGFKDYCALLLFKGALLEGPDGILIQQTENVQAGRQIRFTAVREIEKMEATLKAYIREAIEVEKSGRKVELRNTSEFAVPEELRKKWDEIPALKTAFEALTPGRQRAYLLYFSAPKQSKTRESRVEKCMGRIFDGKGLKDP